MILAVGAGACRQRQARVDEVNQVVSRDPVQRHTGVVIAASVKELEEVEAAVFRVGNDVAHPALLGP